MCHSARLAHRNLPAGQKKTTKGLSNKKVLQRRVEIFLKFEFLKFRLTGKYFSEIQKDGHFDEKERKNRTTTNLVRNCCARKREKRSLLSWQSPTIRPIAERNSEYPNQMFFFIVILVVWLTVSWASFFWSVPIERSLFL